MTSKIFSDSLIDNQEENPFFLFTDHENPFLNFEDSLFDTEYDDLIDHMEATEKEIHKSNRSKGKLKIMRVSCRSLKKKKKKKKKFYALIDSEQPDIILGTESHLDSSHFNSETFPAPYPALRKDRNINEGGVFIAYRDDLNLIEIENTGEKSELKTAKLIIKNTTPLYLAVYYRLPSSTVEDLENL